MHLKRLRNKHCQIAVIWNWRTLNAIKDMMHWLVGAENLGKIFGHIFLIICNSVESVVLVVQLKQWGFSSPTCHPPSSRHKFCFTSVPGGCHIGFLSCWNGGKIVTKQILYSIKRINHGLYESIYSNVSLYFCSHGALEENVSNGISSNVVCTKRSDRLAPVIPQPPSK